MNIENVRAYLEITATGSFQQAAENLHITQSAMSARIKNLEDLLKRPLFNRKRNGTTLTPAGKAFYHHALTLIRSWEMARQEVALSNRFNTFVSLGVQLNHWQSIANPWLKWMENNTPNVATQMLSDYSDRLMSMLRDSLLDVAVLYAPQQNPDLVIEHYAHETLLLVSTEPRKVQKGRVPGYIYTDWGRDFRTKHIRAFPDIQTHHISVGLASVALNHILEQGGSAYLMANDVEALLEEETLYLVEGAPEFTLTTYLAYFGERRDTPAVTTALEGLAAIRQPGQSKIGAIGST